MRQPLPLSKLELAIGDQHAVVRLLAMRGRLQDTKSFPPRAGLGRDSLVSTMLGRMLLPVAPRD